MTSRFLLVSGVARDGLVHPAWPDVMSSPSGEPAADGTWVSWRLTGANHRELGRSVEIFPNVRAVLLSINHLRAAADRLQRVVAASPKDARWTWRVADDGTTLATSSRAYSRNRECLYNLQTFLAALPIADVSDALPHRRLEPSRQHPVIPAPSPSADEAVDAAGYAG